MFGARNQRLPRQGANLPFACLFSPVGFEVDLLLLNILLFLPGDMIRKSTMEETLAE